MDYTTLTDEELTQAEQDILNERERRRDLVNLPIQIEAMTQKLTKARGKGKGLNK